MLDITKFDPYERQVLTDLVSGGRTLREAIQICIDNVEGDWSQLSGYMKRFINVVEDVKKDG